MALHVVPEIDDAARSRSVDQEEIAAAVAFPLKAIEGADGVRITAADHLGLCEPEHQIGVALGLLAEMLDHRYRQQRMIGRGDQKREVSTSGHGFQDVGHTFTRRFPGRCERDPAGFDLFGQDRAEAVFGQSAVGGKNDVIDAVRGEQRADHALQHRHLIDRHQCLVGQAF